MAKRIVFISLMNNTPWGGSEELWSEAALSSLRSGYSTFVSVMDWGDLLNTKISQLKQEGAVLQLRKMPASPKSRYEKLIKKLRVMFKKDEGQYFKKLLDFSPDAIFINQGGCYDFFFHDELLKTISLAKVPYFIICHFNTETGVLTNNERMRAKQVFGQARHVYFVSDRNRVTCFRQLALKLNNSSVVVNPVNLVDYSYVPWSDSEIVKFACVARLDCNYKGQDLLMQALSSDHWKNRDWVLNIYGTGHDKNFLKELASYFKLESKIIFWDFDPDIRNIWSKNQILVLPSIGEGTPLSLVEAMICGRPSIVTDVGGDSEYIIEGETGYLAEAPSPKYISDALERAWMNRKNWKQQGEEAHKFVLGKIDRAPGKTLLDNIISLI